MIVATALAIARPARSRPAGLDRPRAASAGWPCGRWPRRCGPIGAAGGGGREPDAGLRRRARRCCCCSSAPTAPPSGCSARSRRGRRGRRRRRPRAMLGGDPAALFLGARLDQPLGYINGQAAFFLLAAWPCIAAAEQRRSAWLAGARAGRRDAHGGARVLSQSRGVAAAAVAVRGRRAVPGARPRAARVGARRHGAPRWPCCGLRWPTSATALAGSGSPTETLNQAAVMLLVVAVAAGAIWAAGTIVGARAGRPRVAAPRRSRSSPAPWCCWGSGS